MAFSESLKKETLERFRTRASYERRIDKEIELKIKRYRKEITKLQSQRISSAWPCTVIAEGDSWFNYTIAHDIPYYIEKRPCIKLLNLASPGDEVREMITPKQLERLARELKSGATDNTRYDAFIFSGGGNDLLRKGRFYYFLNNYHSGMNAKDLVNTKIVNCALAVLKNGFETIISTRDENSPETKIYFHSYDFAQPTGKPVCFSGPWLKPGLDRRKVPKSLQPEVVREFLLIFDRALKGVVKTAANAELVPTQGTVEKSEWANEIHPTNKGFKKLASKFFTAIEADFAR